MWKEDFLNYLSKECNYSGKTVKAYGTDLGQFEDFFKAREQDLTWDKVDKDIIRLWVMELMDSGKATSVNRKLSSLRTFYRYLLRQGLVEHDPVHMVNGPKKQKPLPYFLKESETEMLHDRSLYVEGWKGSRDFLIIEVFYETGIRLAELFGLDVRDVDLSSCQIKVTGKRDKQRIIPFGNGLLTQLQDYLGEMKEAFPDYPQGPLFLDEDGHRLGYYKIHNLVKKYLGQVTSLEKHSPHVLRHTFATQMLNNDSDLEVVRQLLGHESIATTEIYTHTTFEELKKVYDNAHPRA